MYKYAIYKIMYDAWYPYSSNKNIKNDSCTISISDKCFEHLQKIESFPCGNDGTTNNLEKRILEYNKP